MTAAAVAGPSNRSTAIPIASGEPNAVSAAAVASRSSRDLASTATRAPSAAKQSAAARPMPVVPPETITAAPPQSEIHRAPLCRAAAVRQNGAHSAAVRNTGPGGGDTIGYGTENSTGGNSSMWQSAPEWVRTPDRSTMNTFRAIAASEPGPARLQELTDADLPEGDVTIAVPTPR